MRRVFKTRHFAQWLKKTELSDNLLLKAVNEMEHGLIDANDELNIAVTDNRLKELP